jgi:hypothetical protein
MDRGKIDRMAGEVASGSYGSIQRLFRAEGIREPDLIWDPSEDHLSSQQHRFMLSYWKGLKHGPKHPLQTALRPEEMGPVLGNLILLDVIDEGWDFRYRLHGSLIADRFGVDLTGLRTSQYPFETWAKFFLIKYRAILAKGRPLYSSHWAPSQIAATHWERLTLPLEDGSGEITRLLIAVVAGTWRPSRGDMPSVPPRGKSLVEGNEQ